MRRPAAALLLAGSLLLPGCSVLSDGGDDAASGSGTAADRRLPSTAWTKAARADVEAGGTLRLAVGQLPPTFNPLHADAAGSDLERVLEPTSGSAIRVTEDGGWQVDPLYAESVEVVDDAPLTVDVRLNPDAVWQDGEPVTAADMVAAQKALGGSDRAFEVTSTEGYEDIAAVRPGDDDFSYSVVFEEPTADWPRYVYPRLPRSVTKDAKTFNSALRDDAAVSNGPFVTSAVDREAGTVTQVRNPRWWGPTPRLAKITWRTGDTADRAQSYLDGELDALDVDPDVYDAVKDTGTVQRSAGVEWTQVTLNGARGPLRDVEVRRAVAHAIDRTAIADRASEALGARGVPLGSLVLVPGQRGYSDSSAAIEHDPARARELLAEAGWKATGTGSVEKDGKPLELTMPVRGETPTNASRAAAIRDDLAEVGITVKLTEVKPADFFTQRVVPLDFDLVTFTWRGSAFPVVDAEPLFYPLDSGQNYTGLADDALDEQWDEASAAVDDDDRHAKVRGLDERLFQDVPMVPIGVNPEVVALDERVVNYGASQFERPDWTLVGFAKE